MGYSPVLTGGWGGSKNQLLDGYRYPHSDFTEWKLVVPNVCISNFMTIPSSVYFSTANLSFGCKGVMDHVDFALLLAAFP